MQFAISNYAALKLCCCSVILLVHNNLGGWLLVATDAAGEGVNLQNANLMVNYDLPWNPNRLEQRFGRIHRIGQTEVCPGFIEDE